MIVHFRGFRIAFNVDKKFLKSDKKGYYVSIEKYGASDVKLSSLKREPEDYQKQ